MFGEPGRRWSSASAMTRRWSPSSAGMGMFRERAAGPCRGRGTDAEGGNPGVAVAQWNDMAGPPRMGADGRAVRWVAMRRWRAVVGQWRGLARSGLVRIGLVGGHFGMLRFAVGGLASSGGCHTLFTSGAKHDGTQGDTLRRFLQVGGRGGTSWDR